MQSLKQFLTFIELQECVTLVSLNLIWLLQAIVF